MRSEALRALPTVASWRGYGSTGFVGPPYARRPLTNAHEFQRTLPAVLCLCAGLVAVSASAQRPDPAAPFVAPKLAFQNADAFSLLSRPQGVSVQSPAAAAALAAGTEALKRNDFPAAIVEFTKALAVDPDNAGALWGRAASYANTGENAKAEADFDAALAHATAKLRTEIRVGMSHFHDQEKRYDLALADIDACLQAEPDKTRFLEMRGQINSEAGRPDQAFADFTEAIRLSPDNPDSYRYRTAFLIRQKRYDEALADISQAIVLDPSTPSDFYERSMILTDKDRNQAALADLRSALRLSPKDPLVLNDLAWLLATCHDKALRDGKRAVDYATQACELEAWKSGSIIDTLAAACALVGDYGSAVKWQQRAVDLSQDGEEKKEMVRRLELYRAGKPYTQEAPDATAVAWETLRYQTFDTVWQTVSDAYFDPDFGGVKWNEVRTVYRKRLDEVKDVGQLRELLGRMLGELRKTHFAIIPRETAVFNPSERVRIGSVGVELTCIGNRPAVASIGRNPKAAAPGLRPGDVITSVNGRPLEPLAESLSKAGFSEARVGAYLSGYVESFLTAAVGSSATLGVSDSKGMHREVKVTCGPSEGAWSDPIGYFPSMPIRSETRWDGKDVAVIKFNIFVVPVMRQIRSFMKTVGPGSGLVIDLRGNSGGITVMAAGICGLICRDEASLGTMRMRDNASELEVYPVAHPFSGPVAVLIDSRSASTSEILAAGVRDIGRARVFGQRSPGIALASLYKVLPTGDMFQYALADFTTPRGSGLEGAGVEPDVAVAPTSENLAEGHDPALEAAEAWIRQNLSGKPGVTP